MTLGRVDMMFRFVKTIQNLEISGILAGYEILFDFIQARRPGNSTQQNSLNFLFIFCDVSKIFYCVRKHRLLKFISFHLGCLEMNSPIFTRRSI